MYAIVARNNVVYLEKLKALVHMIKFQNTMSLNVNTFTSEILDRQETQTGPSRLNHVPSLREV